MDKMPVFVLGIKAPLSVVTKLLCKEPVPQQIRYPVFYFTAASGKSQGFPFYCFNIGCALVKGHIAYKENE